MFLPDLFCRPFKFVKMPFPEIAAVATDEVITLPLCRLHGMLQFLDDNRHQTLLQRIRQNNWRLAITIMEYPARQVVRPQLLMHLNTYRLVLNSFHVEPDPGTHIDSVFQQTGN